MLASPERRYLLSILSPQLKTEAMVHMNKTGLGQVQILDDLPHEVLLQLSLLTKVTVYPGHEYVNRCGEPAVHFSIVQKGLLISKGRLLRRNQTFGEESALGQNVKYIASSFTATYASVARLAGQDMQHLLAVHANPGFRARFRKRIAHKFAQEGLRNYVQYCTAARTGKLAEFEADYFNQGLAPTTLFRMWMLHESSEGDIRIMEQCAR